MFVYLIEAEGTGKYKIGVSKHPDMRIKNLQTGNGEKLVLIKSCFTNHNFVMEQALHNRFCDKKVVGEWFELTTSDVMKFEETCRDIEKTFDFLLEENFFYQKKSKRLKN